MIKFALSLEGLFGGFTSRGRSLRFFDSFKLYSIGIILLYKALKETLLNLWVASGFLLILVFMWVFLSFNPYSSDFKLSSEYIGSGKPTFWIGQLSQFTRIVCGISHEQPCELSSGFKYLFRTQAQSIVLSITAGLISWSFKYFLDYFPIQLNHRTLYESFEDLYCNLGGKGLVIFDCYYFKMVQESFKKYQELLSRLPISNEAIHNQVAQQEVLHHLENVQKGTEQPFTGLESVSLGNCLFVSHAFLSVLVLITIFPGLYKLICPNSMFQYSIFDNPFIMSFYVMILCDLVYMKDIIITYYTHPGNMRALDDFLMVMNVTTARLLIVRVLSALPMDSFTSYSIFGYLRGIFYTQLILFGTTNILFLLVNQDALSMSVGGGNVTMGIPELLLKLHIPPHAITSVLKFDSMGGFSMDHGQAQKILLLDPGLHKVINVGIPLIVIVVLSFLHYFEKSVKRIS